MQNVNILNPIRIGASVPVSAYIIGSEMRDVRIVSMPGTPWTGSPNVTINQPVSAYIISTAPSMVAASLYQAPLTIDTWDVVGAIPVSVEGTATVAVSNEPYLTGIRNGIDIDNMPPIVISSITPLVSAFITNPNEVVFGSELTVNGTVSAFMTNPNEVTVTMSGSTLVSNNSGTALYVRNEVGNSLYTSIQNTPGVNITSVNSSAFTGDSLPVTWGTTAPVYLSEAISGSVSINSAVSAIVTSVPAVSATVTNTVPVSQSGTWAITGSVQPIAGSLGTSAGNPLYTAITNSTTNAIVTGYVGALQGVPLPVADQTQHGWIKTTLGNSVDGAILAANGRYRCLATTSASVSVVSASGSASGAVITISDTDNYAQPKTAYLTIICSGGAAASGNLYFDPLQSNGGTPEFWFPMINDDAASSRIQTAKTLNISGSWTGGTSPNESDSYKIHSNANTQIQLKLIPWGTKIKVNFNWTDVSGPIAIFANWILIY